MREIRSAGPGVKLVIGPPGTGKTTRLLNEIDGLLSAGADPRQIAFVSFTRAAAREARERACDRFNLEPNDFEWFRTIHSMAFRAIGKRQVFGDDAWKDFGETFSYSFSEQDERDDREIALCFEKDGDCLRSLDTLVRVMRCSPDEAILHAGEVPPHVTSAEVVAFQKRFSEYKRLNDLVDFTDMLEIALRGSWRPPVRFAFVDEAQDNSRLQNELVSHWFAGRAEGLCYAGDDDQAIFGWAGGDRGALVALARTVPTEILTQSWRIPARVHALANAIIEENTSRVAKQYRPREERGERAWVDDADEAVRSCDGNSLILQRNHMFAAPYRKACLAQGRRFSCEVGQAAPLDCTHTLGAFRAVCAWRANGQATAQDFVSLLSLVPSRLEGRELLARGTKTRAKANEDFVPVWRAREQYALGALVDVATSPTPFALCLGISSAERDYLDLVAHRDPWLKAPRVVITSMHRSKGREADTVCVSPSLTPRTYRRWAHGTLLSSDEERSVQYVGVTRARKKLLLTRPDTRLYFPLESYARRA